MEFQREATSEPSPSSSFVRRSVVMVAFGVAGLVGLAASTVLQAVLEPSLVAQSGLPADASLPVVVASSLAVPAVLVVLAGVVGAATAPAVGLRSLVHDRVARGTPVVEPLRAFAPRALAVGLATGVGIVGLDAVLTSFVPAAAPASVTEQSLSAVLASVPARFLFGGIAEELLLRWGLVSVLAWLLAAVVPGERDRAVAWTAVVLAAVVFGLAHLPAAAAGTTLTAPVVARVVVLNAAAGVVFGWLYVVDALEAAMLAHVAAHVPLLAAAVLAAT